MRRFIYIALGFLLAAPAFAFALSVYTVGQGGTGLPYPTTGFKANTLLVGNGLAGIATTSVGSGLTLSGGVLSATGGGGSGFGTTSADYWITSTSTLPSITTLANLVTVKSSLSGNLQVNSGALYTTATGTITCTGSASCGAGSYVLGSNLTITGSATGQGFSTTSADYWVTATNTLPSITTLANLGTVKTTLSGLLAANSGVLYQQSTSTLTPSAPLTGSFTQVGSGGSIGCTNASSGVTGCLTGTDWNTFNSKQATIAVTWPITLTGATVAFNGLSTSTAAVLGNIPYFSGVNTFANIATSAATCSSGVSCSSFTVVGSAAPSITNTGVTSNVAGSGIAVSGSTGAVTITNTIGYEFPAAATGTTLTFNGGFVATASSTINANATTTGTFFAAIASSSSLYGAGINTCASGNFLTWTAGKFGCAADQTSAGGANPFSWASTYNQISAATTSSLWLQNSTASLFASSTIYVGTGGVGSTSIQYGVPGFEWLAGSLGTDNTFRISSSSGSLALNSALTIDKALKVSLGGALAVTGQTTLATSLTGLLKATAGVVSAATAGTDYDTFAWPFTPSTYGLSASNATGTLIGFTGGLYATASSTIGNAAQAGGLTINGGATTTGRAFFAAGSVTNPGISFSGANTSGFWFTGNAGQVDYSAAGTDALQFDANGLRVQMSGSVGTPSVNVNGMGGLYSPGSNKIAITAGGGFEDLTVDSTNRVGIGSTTPWALFSINPTNTLSSNPAFVVGSSTATSFIIDNAGKTGIGTTSPWARFTIDRFSFPAGSASSSILVTEYQVATSTNKTIDWRDSNNQLYRIGTAATTISFTGYVAGMQIKLVICNPNGTAGAITWGSSIEWAGGTAPTMTTTANQCDVASFIATQATSTLKIFGAVTAGFN